MTAAEKRISRICVHCADEIYPGNPPSNEYAKRAAELLLMTVAHESGGLRWRRQLRYNPFSVGGGFGLFQVQWNSIETSLDYIDARPDLRKRCIEFLAEYGFDGNILNRRAKKAILGILQMPAGDPLGCLFARVHYLARPGAIPADDEGRAAYAKRHYNTRLGKATARDYLTAHRTITEGLA